MAIKQEVNSALIVTVGAISSLLLVVIIIGLQAWFTYEERLEVQQKWAQSKNVQLETLLEQQRAAIAQRGPTTIPIDQAMKTLVERKGKVTFATPATKSATRPR